MARRTGPLRSNALMRAYNQSRTVRPTIKRSGSDDGPPVRAIPGFGSFVKPYNVGHRPSYDRSVPRGPYSTAGKYRAPYNKRQENYIRRRRRPTRPYNHHVQVN